MSAKDVNSLNDRTNTGTNGRRPGKPSAARASANENLPDGRADNSDELQRAIPGTKPLTKRKASKKVATQDDVDVLNARIAELEAAAAQNPPPTPAAAPPTPVTVTPVAPKRAGNASRAPVATPSARQGRPPAMPVETPAARTGGDGGPARLKSLKMIPEPPKGSNIQIGMRLANTEEGKAIYNATRAVVADCVRGADPDLTIEWKEQPLETQLLVVNAAKEKAACLRRMEKDWATHRLANQFLKNRRNQAYKAGTLKPPAKYAYLKANSALRSTSGSRVKKAKLHLEARLTKRALEQQREDEEDEPPRKKARPAGPRDSRAEFVQGSSRDGQQDPPVGNEDDAHPTVDYDYVPGQDDGFGDSQDEMDADSQADESE